jgi:hypothetical protein
MFRGVLFLAAFVLAGAASAQPKNELNESAKAMIGAWEFSNAARSKVCSVTFSDTAVKVGYKLTFDPACTALFPVVSSVAGWRYPEDDLLYLLDADGKALVEFSEVEDGIFEAPTPGVGVLFLHNPATAEPDTNEQQPGSPESPPPDEAAPQVAPPQEAPPQGAPTPRLAPAPKSNGG